MDTIKERRVAIENNNVLEIYKFRKAIFVDDNGNLIVIKKSITIGGE